MVRKEKKLDLESPENIIDDITNAEYELKKKLIDTTKEVGKDREKWLTLREPLAQAARGTTKSENTEIYISAVKSLSMYRERIVGLSSQIGNTLEKEVSLFSASSDSTGTITATTITNLVDGFVIPEYILEPKVDENEVLKRLESLDTSLTKTYKEIDEILYGTNSDPERGALYLIRQVFDHFFGILAPDDDVRRSRFWMNKDDKDKNKIERIERIRYAANKHIKIKKKRKGYFQTRII